MTEARVKATIYLPEGIHRRLKIRAAEERSSMTDLVLQAIEDLLQRSSSAGESSRPSGVTESGQ